MKNIILLIFLANLCFGQASSIKTVYEKNIIVNKTDSSQTFDVTRLTLFKDSVEIYNSLNKRIKHKNNKIEVYEGVGIGGGPNQCKGKYIYKKDTILFKMVLYQMDGSNIIDNPMDCTVP